MNSHYTKPPKSFVPDLILIGAILLIFGIIAFMTGNDVASCMDKGNTETACAHAFNR